MCFVGTKLKKCFDVNYDGGVKENYYLCDICAHYIFISQNTVC